MRLLRTSMVTLAVAGSLLAPDATAASADALTFVATGNYLPGIPASGCAPQNVGFFTTAAVDQGTHGGTYSFGFAGGTACSSLTTEAGVGNLGGGITGVVQYARSGPVVTFSGRVAFGTGDPDTAFLLGECVWAPTSVSPVNGYAMACEWVLQPAG